MREDLWETHIEGLEQRLNCSCRSGDAETVDGAFYLQLHGAQHL